MHRMNTNKIFLGVGLTLTTHLHLRSPFRGILFYYNYHPTNLMSNRGCMSGPGLPCKCWCTPTTFEYICPTHTDSSTYYPQL